MDSDPKRGERDKPLAQGGAASPNPGDDPTATQALPQMDFGPYRIEARLGAGGMGVVYRARDERLDRSVALKVLPRGYLENATARERFRREARALSQLNHPNICTIHDVGESGEQIYIAMEHIEGKPLRALVHGGPMPPETVVRLAVQIADAIDHAHSRSILHRDLKSANVMVTPEGRAKVLDFGLAKHMDELPSAGKDPSVQPTLTEAGSVVGTIAYMAPELLRGDPADVRSDIWALGVMMYEMAAGTLPFHGTTTFAMSAAILRETPAPLPSAVPAPLQSVIQRCLSKEPNERYQHAAEVRAVLETLGSGSVRVSSVAAAAPVAPSRKRWVMAAGALAVVAFVAVAAGVPQIRNRIIGKTDTGQLDSVAVLPFENLSHDANEDYFTDGMTEEMITELSKVRQLRVISRPSVMTYKATTKTPAAVAKELNVKALVVGSVMRIGNRVRISVQLIRADGEQNLWAESYERDMRDVLALQGEVSRNIAREVRVNLSPGEEASLASARQVDPQVYQLYLKGRFYAEQAGALDAPKTAISYFEQAIQADPSYAPAYAQLSLAYSSLSSKVAAPKEVMPKAKAAAQKALELDETLSDAHTALAIVELNYDWDWNAGEAELRRAIELNPSSSEAHATYGRYFIDLKEYDKGVAELKRARDLDPLSLQVEGDIIVGYVSARLYDQAIQEARQSLAKNPDFAWAYGWMGIALMEKGQFPEALAASKRAFALEPNYTTETIMANIQAASGNKDEARKLLADVEQQASTGYVCAFEVAEVYTNLGDNDHAFQWMQKGVKEQCDCLTHLIAVPWIDPLRTDPRYANLVKQVGFPAQKQ